MLTLHFKCKTFNQKPQKTRQSNDKEQKDNKSNNGPQNTEQKTKD